MNIIIDTNILISAVIRDKLPEKIILWIIKNPLINWFVSKEILNEYINVLKRPKFNLTEEQLKNWHELINKATVLIYPNFYVDFKRDILDEKFINCALTCNSDYITSGDKDFNEVEELFGIKVISVSDFYNKFIIR